MVFVFIGSRFRILEMVIFNSLPELKEVSIETFNGPDSQGLGGIFLFRNYPKGQGTLILLSYVIT